MPSVVRGLVVGGLLLLFVGMGVALLAAKQESNVTNRSLPQQIDPKHGLGNDE